MELGKTWTIDFCTHSATTGSVSDADSLPQVRIFEDDQDDPMAYIPTVDQRGALTGQYRVTIVATEGNGFEKGKSYNAIATAAVGGITGKQPVDSFIIEDTMEKLTNVAAIMEVPPIPASFEPTGIVAKPVDPGTIDDMFPPDHEFYAEINELYDTDTKTWKDKREHSAEAEALVANAETERTAYAEAYAAWKQEYDIQRYNQWRAYVAEKLITITE
jgi:hypothetical protein